MSGYRRWFGAAFVAVLIGALARTGSAHPAGFTSVNRYIGVSCDAQSRVHIAYLLDFAELPAYAEIEQLDADHDGSVSPAEQRAYLDHRLPPLLEPWTVEVNGVKGALRVSGSSLEALPGERGLSTLRIAADLAVDVAPPDPGAGDVRVRVVDPVFADRSGWRQMAAEATTGAAVVDGPASRSGDALAYANPALSSAAAGGPPRIDDGTFSFRIRASPSPATSGHPSVVATEARGALHLSPARSARGRWTFSALAFALALSMRAVHARAPGHGKALFVSYVLLLGILLGAFAWVPALPRPW